jgi:hypothetical protein
LTRERICEGAPLLGQFHDTGRQKVGGGGSLVGDPGNFSKAGSELDLLKNPFSRFTEIFSNSPFSVLSVTTPNSLKTKAKPY